MRALTPPPVLPPLLTGPGPRPPPPAVPPEVGLVLSGRLESIICVSDCSEVITTDLPDLLALGVVAVSLPVQPSQGQLGDLARSVAVMVFTVHSTTSQGGVQSGGLNPITVSRESQQRKAQVVRMSWDINRKI